MRVKRSVGYYLLRGKRYTLGADLELDLGWGRTWSWGWELTWTQRLHRRDSGRFCLPALRSQSMASRSEHSANFSGCCSIKLVSGLNGKT